MVLDRASKSKFIPVKIPDQGIKILSYSNPVYCYLLSRKIIRCNEKNKMGEKKEVIFRKI